MVLKHSQKAGTVAQAYLPHPQSDEAGGSMEGQDLPKLQCKTITSTQKIICENFQICIFPLWTTYTVIPFFPSCESLAYLKASNPLHFFLINYYF